MNLRFIQSISALALCATLMTSGKAATASVVVVSNPVADAFVDSAQPTGNFGGAGAVAVSAAGLSQGEFQSVLRFDTSTAKTTFDSTFGAGQWTIQSITLRLTAAPSNNAIFNTPAAGQFNLSWMQNDSWTEGSGMPGMPGATGVTFATLPSFLSGADEALGTYSYSGATSGAFNYNLGLTSGMTADAAAGNLLSLRMFAADSTVSFIARSRSFNTAGDRPVLSITAVPEPASFLLMAAGGAMLLMRRTRRAS